ncbi:MAG TPA: hypothetical protein VM422_03025 [Amaricoccus sp.]|nr:hypothetical protein [Amaricoccus sp.]
MLAVECRADRGAGDVADRAADDGAGGAAVVDRPAGERADAGADQRAGAGAAGAASGLVQPAITATPKERTIILLAFLMSASRRFVFMTAP